MYSGNRLRVAVRNTETFLTGQSVIHKFSGSCETLYEMEVNVRSSWRGSHLNVHTISMENTVSQLPDKFYI